MYDNENLAINQRFFPYLAEIKAKTNLNWLAGLSWFKLEVAGSSWFPKSGQNPSKTKTGWSEPS